MFTYIENLRRFAKSFVVLATDVLLLPLSTWTAIGLRRGIWSFPQIEPWWRYVLVPILAIPVYVRMGLYSAVIRNIDGRALVAVALAVTISVRLFAGLLALLELPSVPRGAHVICWLIAFIYIGAGRFLVRAALRSLVSADARRKIPVAIYGAGNADRQLAVVLNAGPQYRQVAALPHQPGRPCLAQPELQPSEVFAADTYTTLATRVNSQEGSICPLRCTRSRMVFAEQYRHNARSERAFVRRSYV